MGNVWIIPQKETNNKLCIKIGQQKQFIAQQQQNVIGRRA